MNMQEQHKPGFVIRKFWTNYTPDGKGGFRSVDMVAYGPIGSPNVTVDAVSRLSKLQPWEPGSENVAAYMAHKRWEVIGAAYAAWKKGEEIPLNGTPLAAWPGCSKEQAEALKMTGIRTVEEVADMSDSVLTKVNLPGMRDMKASAAAFLKAADRTAISTELAKKDEEIAVLREQMAEQSAQMAELLSMVKEQMADDAPKRRGRPPKVEAEADAA